MKHCGLMTDFGLIVALCCFVFNHAYGVTIRQSGVNDCPISFSLLLWVSHLKCAKNVIQAG